MPSNILTAARLRRVAVFEMSPTWPSAREMLRTPARPHSGGAGGRARCARIARNISN